MLKPRIIFLSKLILFIYFFLFFTSSIFSSCFSFRISDKQLQKSFQHNIYKPTQHQIMVAERCMSYLSIGNNELPVAFFVHGSPGSSSAFLDFMKDTNLLKRVQIVAVDRAGFGKSNFGEGVRTLAFQSELLRPLVASYKKASNKLILIGHSLGGPLIAKMAMDYPELIDGLVIVAGAISPELEPNEKWFRVPFSYPPLKWLLPPSFRASNTELLHLKSSLESMMPYWQNIVQPVTIIHGSKDKLVSPKNTEFAKKMLPNSSNLQFVIVKEMNHFIPWSHPQLISDAIFTML